MDTKALESLEEATQSKDSVSLSLLDDVSEINLHESAPEGVILDLSDNKREQKEDYSQFIAGKEY